MRIGRTLPPATAPLSFTDTIRGLIGVINPNDTIAALKQSLGKHFNKKHCFLISSGKAAIALSLQALSKLHPERNEIWYIKNLSGFDRFSFSCWPSQCNRLYKC